MRLGTWIAGLFGARVDAKGGDAGARTEPLPDGPGHVPHEQTRAESRRLGAIVADIMRRAGKEARAGVTTGDLERFLREQAREQGALPGRLGFRGFPAAAAISVNEGVLHGIPGTRRLVAGDLVTIEFSLRTRDGHAHQGWTFAVGTPNERDHELLRTGREALSQVVHAVRPRARVGDLGHLIQTRVGAGGFSVVRDYVGYGIGERRLQPPELPGVGRPSTGPSLRAGWVLNVHVILKHGTHDVTTLPGDDWAVVAKDGERAALFTAMVEVTEEGGRLLTR